MKLELCTDSVEGAVIASRNNFNSIELCSALSVGGLTPNYGLIKMCVENSKVEVHVMIRHKEGGFYCDSNDVELMKIDIEAVSRAGAHGVVFGLLTKENEVSDKNRELVELAKSLGLKTTFHRAFDFVADPFVSIEKIISLGFDRLLTSGFQPKAIQGIELLKELQSSYGDKIKVIAGSGVNSNNALDFKTAGLDFIHFTARKSHKENIQHDMGQEMMTDEDKIKSLMSVFVSN